MRRGAWIGVIAVAAIIVLLVVAVIFFTRTEAGVERSGRFAIDQLRGFVEGELVIDRITSRGLLSGVTLHGVSLHDPDGRLFLRADSARLTYGVGTLLRGSIVFDRLILHSPDVAIERLPGQDEWNYQRVFPPDTAPPDTARHRVVLIQDVRVTDGRVTVRFPWEPDGPVEPGDTARVLLEPVPGGLARTVRFTRLNGRLPRIIWEAPEEEGRLVEVGELQGLAYIYDTPLEVNELAGVVVIRDSLLSFQAPHVRLPDSDLTAVGRIIIEEPENRYDVQIDGQDIAFADFQWLYPRFPQAGGGSLQLRIQSRSPGSILWLARDARLRAPGTELAGSFGVVTGDTLHFTNVDLDASPLDLELLQRLLPTDLELEGLLVGTVEVEGT